MTGYELLDQVVDQILNPIIQLMFAIALVWFLWGLFQFIRNSGSEEAVTTGKRHMIWGLIGLFIMSSVFGILNVIVNFLTDFR